MSFKDILAKLGEKSKQRKELIRQLDEQVRIHKLVEERQKSSNLRELERLEDEDFEEAVKQRLDIARKKKDEDIKFNHNPLNAKDIMKSEWEVLKEPNQFAKKSNMFSNRDFIHKDNPQLHKNNPNLHQTSNIFKNNMHLMR